MFCEVCEFCEFFFLNSVSSVSSVKSASSVGLLVYLNSVSSVSSLYFCDFSWTQVKVSLFVLSFIHSVRNFFFGLSSDLATPSLFLFSVLATSSLVSELSYLFSP